MSTKTAQSLFPNVTSATMSTNKNSNLHSAHLTFEDKKAAAKALLLTSLPPPAEEDTEESEPCGLKSKC